MFAFTLPIMVVVIEVSKGFLTTFCLQPKRSLFVFFYTIIVVLFTIMTESTSVCEISHFEIVYNGCG